MLFICYFFHVSFLFHLTDKRGIPDGGNNHGQEDIRTSGGSYLGTARGASLTPTAQQYRASKALNRTSSMSSSSNTAAALATSSIDPRNSSVTSGVLTSSKDSSDYASCESIVSGKGRVSVLKKSSQSSLNSVLSTNSCLRTSVTESRSSSRREKHGVSFAVPYTDPGVYIRPRGLSDSGTQYFDKRPMSSKPQDKLPLMSSTNTIGTSTYLENTSYDHFSNMDEFGIIVGASSDSSIVSGTYSYDPVLSVSTDSDASTTRKCSPMRIKKSLEVDPWRVDNNLLNFNETDCVLIRKDTPPPKPVIPSTSDKDLREFIKRKHTRNLSMSSQTLRRSRGVSSENLVLQCDSTEASMNSLDQKLALLYNDQKEVRYENIATISAAINNKKQTADDILIDRVKKIKSPDESTYL